MLVFLMFAFCFYSAVRKTKDKVSLNEGVISRGNAPPADVRSDKSVEASTCSEFFSLSLVFDQPGPFGEPECTEIK